MGWRYWILLSGMVAVVLLGGVAAATRPTRAEIAEMIRAASMDRDETAHLIESSAPYVRDRAQIQESTERMDRTTNRLVDVLDRWVSVMEREQNGRDTESDGGPRGDR